MTKRCDFQNKTKEQLCIKRQNLNLNASFWWKIILKRSAKNKVFYCRNAFVGLLNCSNSFTFSALIIYATDINRAIFHLQRGVMLYQRTSSMRTFRWWQEGEKNLSENICLIRHNFFLLLLFYFRHNAISCLNWEWLLQCSVIKNDIQPESGW